MVLVLAACRNENPAFVAPSLNGGLYATFQVGDEEFHASITSAEGMEQARAAWNKTSSATIPNALLVCHAVDWNGPWGWYLDPQDLRFAELTTEVCDGTPSYVDEHCEEFGAGRYCPWSAEMTDLRDCTTDPACPPVP